MPNRILKESICTSETIDQLSPEAECFFYRLLVQCDDFGRMDGRASVLRSRCFPLRLEKITDKQVDAWLKDCAKADLLWLYTDDGRRYLQIAKWDKHQQRRAKYSKYPQPLSMEINGNQLQAIANNSLRGVEESRNEESTIAPEPPAQDGEPDPVKILAEVFEKAAGIALPTPEGPKAKKQVGVTWWNPLREMVKMADGRAPDVMRRTVAKMRADRLNISSPLSVEKVFTSLNGEQQARPSYVSRTPEL